MTAHESTDQLESSAEVAEACLISTGLAHESVGWQSWSWMASLACWQFAGCQLGVQMMRFSSYNRLAGACAHSGGRKWKHPQPLKTLGLEWAWHHFYPMLLARASHKTTSFKGQRHLLMGDAARSCCKECKYTKG